MPIITPISASEEEKLRKKSIYNAPNNLSEKNISPNRVKDFIASPVIGENNSVLAFLKRTISETNTALTNISSSAKASSIYVGSDEPSSEMYSMWYDTSEDE